jgi:predicted alpha/beta superfamily hydrolase
MIMQQTQTRDAVQAATLANTQSYRLASAHVDQTFVIDVAPPPFGPPPGQALPVVYVLDGDMTFGAASVIARALQMGPGAIRPVLVVGVGYVRDRPDQPAAMALRHRDLTPSIDQRYLTMARSAPGPAALPPSVLPGGADDFLDFLEDELKPFIAERYCVDREDAALVGVSLGGLLVLHALFTRPDAFRRYGAVSPSVWWDERMILREETALAARVTDLDRRLFLAVGALEEAQDASARMVSNLYELEATLRARAYPSLQLALQVLPDESHMSVFPAAISRALRALYS